MSSALGEWAVSSEKVPAAAGAAPALRDASTAPSPSRPRRRFRDGAKARPFYSGRRNPDGRRRSSHGRTMRPQGRRGLESVAPAWKNWPAGQNSKRRGDVEPSAEWEQRSGTAAHGGGGARACGPADRAVAAGGGGEAARGPQLAARHRGARCLAGDRERQRRRGAGGAGRRGRRRRGERQRRPARSLLAGDRPEGARPPGRRQEPDRPDAAPPAEAARRPAQGPRPAQARLGRGAARAGPARCAGRRRPPLPLAGLRDRPEVDRGPQLRDPLRAARRRRGNLDDRGERRRGALPLGHHQRLGAAGARRQRAPDDGHLAAAADRRAAARPTQC